MSTFDPSKSFGKVAIIGMNGRFPGAKTLEAFWQNLRDGVESVSFFDDAELEWSALDSLEQQIPTNPIPSANYVKAAAVLDDVEYFDADFFGYSPREASLMDPQARLFLECAWEALEHASYVPDIYPGRIGIYAGAGINTYFLSNLLFNSDLIASTGLDQIKFSNHLDLLVTRVAYKLNLQGPGVNVQTACSTSLVAVHLACQSLLNGECDMALAGGVGVTVPQKVGYLYREGSILSPDGHCRVFDANARGTISGSGLGIVVLKRLEDALADRDCIHAVICGSAINNDGALKVGYTAPSVEGQAKAITEALAIANIDADTIGYIETHGTGTTLGDPVEVAALTQAFRTQTPKREFCAIGSVKSNIGHLGAAAGIAGLIKTVLALKHRQIPPSLHFEQPNPQIDFATSPFYVNATLRNWTTNGTPRRAGISSFGIGGTNAHVIVEEAPVRGERGRGSEGARGHELIVLSAKTPTALDTATEQLVIHLQQHPELALADVAYTLQVGRKAFNYRRTLVCRDREEAIAGLSNPQQHCLSGERATIEPPVVFLFPGQGAQYPNMGRELYQRYPCFREWVERACALLEPELGLDLRQVLYGDAQTNALLLTQTAYAQPALFVVEYGLAQLWMSWGVQPQVMMGHSVGEYVAACLAGVFSLEEALKLVAVRGRLMQSLPSGAMLSVALSAAEVRLRLDSGVYRDLALAAVNAPELCAVSGQQEGIAQLETDLKEQGIACRRLQTSHAFHSPMMEPIGETFAAYVKQVKRHPPTIPFISNVTGTWIKATEAIDPNYWATHLRQTVCFAAGMTELAQDRDRLFLEVGPGRTLSTLTKQIVQASFTSRNSGNGQESSPSERYPPVQQRLFASMRHPNEKQSDLMVLWHTLGRLWVAGVSVDWSGLYTQQQRQRIPLPTYPFERQRYWIEPIPAALSSSTANGPVSKRLPADWLYLPSWKRSVQPINQAFMEAFSWLIFVDSCGIGSQLVERLQQAGQMVVTVKFGTQFTQASETAYTIAPDQPGDYQSLIRVLQRHNQIPDCIVHCWGITSEQFTPSQSEWFECCQTWGFNSVLFLIQAIGQQSITNSIQMTIVTSQMQEVAGEPLYPEKATVLGLCKVIPQEYLNVTCRSLDMVVPQPSSDQEHLITQLLAELSSNSTEPVIAYRGQHRWVQSFEPIQAQPLPLQPRLRDRGTYLITGGWGDLGLLFADYLARTVHANLVLVGRSPLPPRDQWSDWLATHVEHDSTSRKIRQLQAIEASGSTVLLVCADVADLEQMQAAIGQAEEQFGALHGVIHAAGVRVIHAVQQISLADCQRQFQPKVAGLYVLEQVLCGKALDFCLLVSSLSSVLGVLGMAAYPAAHLFMDAFAQQQNQRGSTPWLSVNWDNWQLDAEATLPSSVLAITREEGLALFQRLFSMSLFSMRASQVVVSTADLPARLAQWTSPRLPQVLSQISSQPFPQASAQVSLPVHERPNLSSRYVAPRHAIEQTLATIWQRLLGLDQVGIHDNFFDLGGDSVLGIQIVAQANRAGLQLTTKQVFEHQTIAELASVAIPQTSPLIEPETMSGSFPLTPIQHWFFEQELVDPHHWNQSVLLTANQPIDPEQLQRAIQALLAHHDALRLRFELTETGWSQHYAPVDAPIPYAVIDLSSWPPSEQDATLAKVAAQFQASLDLSNGPLMRVALFQYGASQPQRLLIVIHHLVVDVTAWRILSEDLQTAYEQLSQGVPIALPAKTASFKQWSEQLTQYAQSPVAQRNLEPWLTTLQPVAPLPVDHANEATSGADRVSSAHTITVQLSVEETRSLLQEIPSMHRLQVQEVLLTALVRVYGQWTGQTTLCLDLEGNGREVGDLAGRHLDVSRTVGWFTTLFPVQLHLPADTSPGEALKTVKTQLRRYSQEGIGYGIGRHLSHDAAAKPLQRASRSEIVFLHLGDMEQTVPTGSLFQPLRSVYGPERSLRGQRSHLWQLTSLIRDQQLQLEWTYSEQVHHRQTIESLAQLWLAELRNLIRYCQSSQSNDYTPSDFSAHTISQRDLNTLLAKVAQSTRRDAHEHQ